MRQEHGPTLPDLQQAVFKIDQIPLAVEFLHADSAVICLQELIHFFQDAHFDKRHVIRFDVIAYDTLEHLVVRQAVYAVFIDIDHQLLPGTGANHDILQVFTHILCQKRRTDLLLSPVILGDKIRPVQSGFAEVSPA